MTVSVADRKCFYSSGSRILLLLLAIFISISPFALNGFWFDDSNISSTYWEVQIRGISLFQFIRETILSWMHVNGRLAPLANLQIYGLHYWIQNVHLFRFAHVFLVVIHIGTFVWLLRRLKVGWNFIGLWLLILVGLFQARNYHDPIASYGFFLQFQGIFLTLAILSLVTWNVTPRTKWLVMSSTLALISLLMYEINIVFYPIALGLLLTSRHPTRLKIRALLTLLAPLIIYALVTFYLRNASEISYPGVRVGSPDLMLATYGKQFLAAFPGVFYFLQWKAEFPISKIFSSFISTPLAWLLMLASLYSGFRCISANSQALETTYPRIREISIIALCLIFITPAFIAISSKYQHELTWGTGYLPVYYSYFGVALIVTASFSLVTERFARLRLPLAMVMASFITANFLVNHNVIEKMDQIFVEPRRSLEQALKGGLLDDLHDGDYLNVADPAYQFMNRGFFYHYSGKKVIIESGLVSDKAEYSSRHYILEHQTKNPYRWKIISPEDVRLIYGEGWSDSEGAHRWSVLHRAVINLQNGHSKPASAKVVFDLNTLKPRNVKFTMNGKTLDNLSSFLNGTTPVHFEISPVILAPGQNSLIIETDVPPESPGKGDSRKLSFVISNVFLTEQQ